MKQLLVFLLLLCSASVSAQDVIVKKDGSTIVCRVVEVTSTEITYKKWSDLNGSNYVMDQSLASAINYENGKKVSLSETTNLHSPSNQIDRTQLYNDKELLRIDAAPQKVTRLRKIGWIGGGVLTALGIATCTRIMDGFWGTDDDDETAIIGGIGLMAGGAAWATTFLLIANHEKKNSQMLESSVIFQYGFKISNGTCLSLGADLLSDRTVGNSTLGLGLRYNF